MVLRFDTEHQFSMRKELKMTEETFTAVEDDETRSVDTIDTDDILLEMLSDKKSKSNDNKDESDSKSKSLEKEKKKSKGKKSKPIKKQTSRKQLKKKAVEKTNTNLSEKGSANSRQSRLQSPQSSKEQSSPQLNLEKSESKSRKSSLVKSRKKSSENNEENANDEARKSGDETIDIVADIEIEQGLVKRDEKADEAVDDKDPDEAISVEEEGNTNDGDDCNKNNQKTKRELKKPPPIQIPDLSEESMLFTDLLVTKRSGSEWEKLVQNTAYSPGSTIQLMRAASIKRRHLSDPDVTASDGTGIPDFIKPTLKLNQDQILLDDGDGVGSPGSPPYPGNMFKFGSKRPSLLPPINQSGQLASQTRRISIQNQKVCSKSSGASNLNLSIKLPKIEPIKRRASQNPPTVQPQTTEHPDWPKPTKIGRGWRIIRRHIIAGMFGYSLNRIRVGVTGIKTFCLNASAL